MRFFRGFLAIKSLVVGVLILALWGRSYFVGDQVRQGNAFQYIQLGSAAGSVIVTFGHDGEETSVGGSWRYAGSKSPWRMIKSAGMEDTLWNRIGFGYNSELIEYPARGMIVNIILPHWFVFLLAIPSAVRWFTKREKRKVEEAQATWECPRCGQMFGAIPNFCPMCGQPILKPKKAA